MEKITEEMKVHEQWYEDADKIRNLDELMGFMKRLGENYEHDYGTVVHALSASILAAGKAFDRQYGGITGFQAGCVMWQFVQKWLPLEGPLKLVEFKELLYPQYRAKFEKVISPETWKWLQEEAGKLIEASPNAHPNVLTHWRDIKSGVVPFGFVVKDEG